VSASLERLTCPGRICDATVGIEDVAPRNDSYADSVHGLFLVTEEFYACNTSEGSAILVYDESGDLVETITGFKFSVSEPAPAINPTKRVGWALGPQPNQLQQFFY
jgi:hypothetical protein